MARSHGFACEWDLAALGTLGVTGQEPITARLADVRLRTLLTLLARQVDHRLQVGLRDGRLIVTTAAAWQDDPSYRLTRLYRFDGVSRPLLREGVFSDFLEAFASSRDDEQSWPEVRHLPGAVLVTTTAEGHRLLERLVRALVETPRPENLVVEFDDSAAERALTEKLRRETTLEVVDEPLAEALARIAREHHITLWLDERELESVGRGPRQRVSRRIPGLPLGAALEHWMDELDLKLFTVDGVVVVAKSVRGPFSRELRGETLDYRHKLPTTFALRKPCPEEHFVTEESSAFFRPVNPRRRRVEEVLARSISLQFDRLETPRVIDELQARTGVPIFICRAAALSVTYRCDNVPLEIALRQMFAPLELDLAVVDDSITLDSGAMEERLYTSVPWLSTIEGIANNWGAYEVREQRRSETPVPHFVLPAPRDVHQRIDSLLRTCADSRNALERHEIELPYASFDRSLAERLDEALVRYTEEQPASSIIDWLRDKARLAVRGKPAEFSERKFWENDAPDRHALAAEAVRASHQVVNGIVQLGRDDKRVFAFPLLGSGMKPSREVQQELFKLSFSQCWPSVNHVVAVTTPAGGVEIAALLAGLRGPDRVTVEETRGRRLGHVTRWDGTFEVRWFHVGDLLTALAQWPMRREGLPPHWQPESRFDPFRSHDQPHLQPLPRPGFPSWYARFDSDSDNFGLHPEAAFQRACGIIPGTIVSLPEIDGPYRIVAADAEQQEEFAELFRQLRCFYGTSTESSTTAPPVGSDQATADSVGHESLRVYDLRPLMKAQPELSEHVIEQMIRAGVRPFGWQTIEENRFLKIGNYQLPTGTAGIAAIAGGVLVRHDAAVHDEVRRLLAQFDHPQWPRLAAMQRTADPSSAADVLARILRSGPRDDKRFAANLAAWVTQPHDGLAEALVERLLATCAGAPQRDDEFLLFRAIAIDQPRFALCLEKLAARLRPPARSGDRPTVMRAFAALGYEGVERLLQLHDFDPSREMALAGFILSYGRPPAVSESLSDGSKREELQKELLDRRDPVLRELVEAFPQLPVAEVQP